MSGLALLYHRDGRQADVAAVWRMLEAAPYLGPDGFAVHHAGEMALGHAKLALTPEEEGERQPLVSPRTGCALVADVRLDNRDALLHALPGIAPDASDAELMLHAYEAWAEDSITRLLGDFACMLWDPRRRRLLCARDSSGQRPLFYRADGRTFAAATEIQQLMCDPSVPVVPNDEHVRDFLTPVQMERNEADGQTTFYQGIFAVPAGHLLIVNDTTVCLRRYWELPARELRYRREEEYVEHFRALFLDVVRSRLRSTRPVGATLSGGLDSSSIVCAAQHLYKTGQVANPGFASYSLVFPGLDCDEAPLIRDVQAKYDFEAHMVPASGAVASLELAPSGFIAAPGKYVSELDPLAALARDRGVRVLLSGEMADASTGGSPLVFDSLLRQGHIMECYRRLREHQRVSAARWRTTLPLHVLLPLLPRVLQQQALTAYAERAFRRDKAALLPRWMPDPLRADLLRRHRQFVAAAVRQRRFANPSRQERYDFLYPPEVSMSADRWSLQIWRPYADRRLHEYLLAIPPEQLYAPHPYADDLYAGSKLIVRRALRGILPESIRTRAVKTHFAALFEDEVRRRWEDYAAVFGPGGESRAVLHGYVDAGAFWLRLQRMREGHWGRDLLYVMRMLQIETWLRSLQASAHRAVTPGAADIRHRLAGPVMETGPSFRAWRGAVSAPTRFRTEASAAQGPAERRGAAALELANTAREGGDVRNEEAVPRA